MPRLGCILWVHPATLRNPSFDVTKGRPEKELLYWCLLPTCRFQGLNRFCKYNEDDEGTSTPCLSISIDHR